MPRIAVRRLLTLAIVVGLVPVGGLSLLRAPSLRDAAAQTAPDARAGIVYRCRVPETAESPYLIRIGSMNTGDDPVTLTLAAAGLSANASVELKSLFPLEIAEQSIDTETWDLPFFGHEVEAPEDVPSEVSSHGSWQDQTWSANGVTYQSFDSPAAVTYDEDAKAQVYRNGSPVGCDDDPHLPAELRVVVVDCQTDPGPLDPVPAWNGTFVDDQSNPHPDCAADTSERQFVAEDITDSNNPFDRGLIETDANGHSDDDAMAALVRTDRQLRLTERQPPAIDP